MSFHPTPTIQLSKMKCITPTKNVRNQQIISKMKHFSPVITEFKMPQTEQPKFQTESEITKSIEIKPEIQSEPPKPKIIKTIKQIKHSESNLVYPDKKKK